MLGAMSTYPAALARALRTNPGRPFVTFIDERTGERIELSLTTYANWIAKASGLLTDEYGLERGMRIRIELPPHWLGTIFVGAALNVGLVLTDGPADVVVIGPEAVASVPGAVTLACSLLPLGVRFREGVPAGVHDVGEEIWGQPDAYTPWDPPQPSDLATAWDGATQADIFERRESAAATRFPTDGSRLLSEANPASPPGFASVCGPLMTNGSLVLVTGAEPARLEAIAASERVTDRFPAQVSRTVRDQPSRL